VISRTVGPFALQSLSKG